MLTREERLEAVLKGLRSALAEKGLTNSVWVIDRVLATPPDEKQRPSDRELAALLPTISKRPPVYYDLVWKLVQDGFKFNVFAEWCKGDIKGRIAWTDDDKAWLRHKHGGRSHEISQGGVTVTRLAHNPKTEGSTPSPAKLETNLAESTPTPVTPVVVRTEAEGDRIPADGVAPVGGIPLGWPSLKEQADYWDSLPQYECPTCGSWHPVSPKQDEVNCLCGKLRVSVDGEFRDGSWRDLTTLQKATNLANP